MLAELEKKPGSFFEISNDRKAKVLLIELELMNLFKETAPRTQIVACGKHPTHYIVALHLTGRKRKK